MNLCVSHAVQTCSVMCNTAKQRFDIKTALHVRWYIILAALYMLLIVTLFLFWVLL